MNRKQRRVPPIGDPDVVRAGIDAPYHGGAMQVDAAATPEAARHLFEAAGKDTADLRESAGWPSTVLPKKPGSKADRGEATPSSN